MYYVKVKTHILSNPCAVVCHFQYCCLCYFSTATGIVGKAISGEVEEDGDPLSISRMEMDDEGNLIVTRPKISGKIKLTYDEDKATEQAMEVDADAYMSELRGQVGVVLHENVDVDLDVSVF